MNPTFREALLIWIQVAVNSFGGPAGQIAVMHRLLVEQKRWVSETRFLHALNYCMLLPGPEAQQLATYIGWLLHGTRGGLVAGGLFVLPGFLAILALSVVYVEFQHAPTFQALFFGIKAAVVAIVFEAVLRVGRRALKNRVMVAIAALAFALLFFLDVPFPLIVVGAGAVGFLGGRVSPRWFDVLDTDTGGDAEKPGLRRTATVATIWLAIWWIPVLALLALLGGGHVLVREALFFSQAAMVTFGGAYSVLAYVAQEAVATYGWLRPGEMLDGLGMAETTPGPLIQVVQFVGFMGAYRNPGTFSPLVAGVLGSVVTVWVTYAPCFAWIFTGAPYIEYLRGRKALTTALSGITAAVVGVILNLGVWFTMHAVVDLASVLIAAAAFVALVRFHVNMLYVLAASALVGVLR